MKVILNAIKLKQVLELLKQVKTPESVQLRQELRDAARENKRIRQFQQIAREEFNRDGELEFDDECTVSLSEDNGAYVQGWKWIDDPKPR